MSTVSLVALAALRFTLRLDVGPELDTNAARSERYLAGDAATAEPIVSPLLRTTAAGQLLWSAGPNQFRVGLTLGGKLFLGDLARRGSATDQAARDRTLAAQNVVVVQAVLDDTLRLGRRLVLGLTGDYYEAAQPLPCPALDGLADTSCHRDFRSGAPRAQATVLLGRFDLTLGGGGRFFTWKPFDDTSFRGAFATLSAGTHLRAGPPEEETEWDLTLSGRLEWRGYRGPRLAGATDMGSPLAPRREDVEALSSLTLTYLGPLLAEASYSLDYSSSSSYGQTFLRHLFALKLVCDLFAGITATFRVQLFFTAFSQPPTFNAGVPTQFTIEDQNRDTFLVDLERPLGRGLSLAARYTGFRAGASNAAVEYGRHLVYVGLSYRLR